MAPDASDLIRIGVIGKPHGVRGAFHVDGAIDATAMKSGFIMRAGEQELRVVTRGGTDARPIVSVEGVDDRDAAAALRGETLFARRETLTPLVEGEWYASDIEGMEVRAAEGQPLGTVARLTNLPSVDVLEVTPAAGGNDLLVPMVADAIVSIDAETRTITVDTGFLDLG
ncbi:MAG: 16S rRNA processing protein RimM [Actinobacteria bacterium]|nr:16S rRNA processing protein RimM [Actinomycetota bacterium]